MSEKGKLFLIPSTIADDTQHKVIPAQTKNELLNIRHFLAENIRTARRFLSSLKIYDSIEPLQFNVLDKGTSWEDMGSLFEPVHQGYSLGVLSESGCPGVADPGALAARYAHQHGIAVVPLVGPSSILLALMASGLNGQCFAFQGYLPIDGRQGIKELKDFEKESLLKGQTQIFIETPYRNSQLLKNLVRNLKADTWLSVAVDLTGSNESIRTMPVRSWNQEPLDLPKLPTIFMFLANK